MPMFSKTIKPLAGGIFIAAFALLLPGVLRPANGTTPFVLTNMPGDRGLSVMTYNIEGLPWPIRFGREQAFEKIGARLRALRMSGEQPHIVVLQEAFTQQAKHIGVEAGYRYIADGPDRAMASKAAISDADRQFERAGSFFDGEQSGKLVDSGLQILSDYPIVSVRRMAFPSYACAGFDCLANKGAVLAMIRVPGVAEPVAVVNVHLNSHKAAHVSDARSLYAYRRQIDALDGFLLANLPAGTPAIVAGDFNVGHRLARQQYFAAHLLKWGQRSSGVVKDALQSCFTGGETCGAFPSDAVFSMRRGRDWQLSIAGRRHVLSASAVAVPFGHDVDGDMLSDHVGYQVRYSIGSPAAAAPQAPRLAATGTPVRPHIV